MQRLLLDVLPVITGNRTQMQQLFQNLITNALKLEALMLVQNWLVLLSERGANINEESEG